MTKSDLLNVAITLYRSTYSHSNINDVIEMMIIIYTILFFMWEWFGHVDMNHKTINDRWI